MGRACAYCGQQRPLTREHLWPLKLHDRLRKANQQDGDLFWLRRIDKDIPNQPVIRDVCSVCNNEALSALDAYICRLFDDAFVNLRKRYERVTFAYDYHLLKRWLLKLSYNSARVHGADDLFALRGVVPYIMDQDPRSGRSVDLFVHLVHPEEVPEKDRSPIVPKNLPEICVPTDHRVGHFIFRSYRGRKVLRAVHLRSFSSFLAFADPAASSRAEQHEFRRAFLDSLPFLRLLGASSSQVVLECDGMGAWQSFQDARLNRLIFDGER